MRTKTTVQKKSRSKVQNLAPEERFLDEDTRRRFEDCMEKRPLHPERGFDLQRASPEIKQMVEQFKWEQLCSHPRSPNTILVREFYAGIPIQEENQDEVDYSNVRGCTVCFSPEEINEYFGLPVKGDAFEKRMKSVKESHMEEIMKKLTVRGTTWEKRHGDDYRIKRSTLLPAAKTWYNFIVTSLLPTTHNQTIDKERIVLLDHILGGKQLNVGRLMHREILACAKRTKGSLFFPCLIEALCKQEGVPRMDTDTAWPVPKPWDATTGGTSPAMPVPQTAERHEKFAEVMDQFMLKQVAYWRFAQEQFLWQKRLFNFNFPRKLMNAPPVFPNWILGEEEEAEPASAEPTPGEQRKKKNEGSRKGKEPVVEEEVIHEVEEEDIYEPVPSPVHRAADLAGEAGPSRVQEFEKETEKNGVVEKEKVVEETREEVDAAGEEEFFDTQDMPSVTTPVRQEGISDQDAAELVNAVASAMASASMALEKDKEEATVVLSGGPEKTMQGGATPGSDADTPTKKKKASPAGTSQKKGKKRGAKEAVITITGDEDDEPIASLMTRSGSAKRRSSRLQAGIFKP